MSVSVNAGKRYNTAILKLFEIILSLDENQQKKLIECAETLFLKEKRTHSRKPCQIPIYYATENQVFSSYIKNISQSGLLIEARKSLPPGDEILMTFRLNGLAKPMKIRGQIAHSGTSGIGVKFIGISRKMEKAIGVLVDQMKD
jgi:Tfp pilus assembly protein PilZ